MLDKYRAAIAAHLRKYLPPSVTVYELGNSLDDTELQRLCLAAPGVGVEIIGADGVELKGRSPYVTVNVGVSVVAGPGRDGQPADSAVLVLAALVAGVIADQRFGLDCMRPESVRATNITSGDQATNNVALWTVTWKQAVDVSNVITWPELDDFLRCYTREKKDGPVTIETHLPGASAGQENMHVLAHHPAYRSGSTASRYGRDPAARRGRDPLGAAPCLLAAPPEGRRCEHHGPGNP